MMRKLAKKLIGSIPFVRNKFKSLRHAKVGKAEFWQMKRDFQIQFLRSTDLMPEHVLFDLGCGTLRGGIPIIQFLQPGNYHGFDIRSEVLNDALLELKEEGLLYKNANLYREKSISELKLDMKFDYIWAFSVFIHLTDQVLNEVLEFSAKHLKSDAKLLANVNLGKMQNGTWQAFPVIWREWTEWEKLAQSKGLQIRNCGTLESLGHHTGELAQDSQVLIEFTLIK